MEALEEEQKRQEAELEAEMLLQQKKRRMQRALERKRIEIEMRMCDEEEEEEKALQKEMLQQRKEQVDRLIANRQRFEQQMATLDDEIKKFSVVKSKTAGAGSLNSANDDNGGNDDNQHKVNADQVWTGPTKAQLAARKGLTYKLRKFSGKPADWPLFYSSYTASNEACGYMNHENLIRLQECLEGNALELVSGQLLLPESVPKVIERLRRHFGRPEQVLQTLLDKVNALDPPKPDDLASFIPFATAVEQLCDHLEAAGLHQHLFNPLLVKNLVAKLPDREKREWVRYQRGKSEDVPKLRTLTDWLMEFDEDACAADVNVDFSLTCESKASPAKEPMQEGELHYHSENASSVVSSSEQMLQPCRMCQNIDHRLRNCPAFKKLSFAERQKLVTSNNLCSICLNRHGGRCNFKMRCNISGCKVRHNPLMHPDGGTVGISTHIRSDYQVMFRMIPVELHHGKKSATVLAFLDEGSSVTLMERNVADQLGIAGIQEQLTIRWSADITRVEKDSQRMDVWVSGVSAEGSDKLLLQSVRTVEKLKLPRQRLDSEEIAMHYRYTRELPIVSYDGQPKLLIGLNNIHSFAPMDVMTGAPEEPIAVKCQLGWSVYGPIHSSFATASYLGYHKKVEHLEKPAVTASPTPQRQVVTRTMHRVAQCAAVPVKLREEPAVAVRREGNLQRDQIQQRSTQSEFLQIKSLDERNVKVMAANQKWKGNTLARKRQYRSGEWNRQIGRSQLSLDRLQVRVSGVRISRVSSELADVTGGGVKTPHMYIPKSSHSTLTDH